MALSQIENIGLGDEGQEITNLYVNTKILDTEKNESCVNIRILDRENNQYLSIWFDEEQRLELIEALKA